MERVHALTEARLTKKLTLEKVAECVGVDTSTVARWERGERSPRPSHKQALERLFGKTASELGLAKVVEPGTIREDSDADDASTAFRNQHVFLRLVRMAWNWPSHVDHHELQAMIILELEGNNIMDFTRRDALRLLASLPLEVGVAGAMLSSSSSKSSTSSKRPNEDILAPIAAGITACRELSRGRELAFASSTVSKYIPMLKDIFSNSSDTRKRKAAADLLVQCYILVANLAVHLEGNSAALRYVKIASGYVEVASNRALAIRIARTEGNAHDYAGRKQQALQAGLQAKYLLETNKGTPFHPHVTSKCYSALANYQAQNGQKQDALASLRKAHTAFFASSDEPVPIWAEQSMGNLLIHDGLTHYYLGLHKKAVDSFEQISTLQDSSETNRIEALIDQVWAGVMREDSRDMELCIALWKQGIQGAISIQSQAQYEDGMAAYTAMRAAWPGEKRIRDLQDYAVHW